MGTPLNLAFPAIVTNPAEIVTNINWSASIEPDWLSFGS
jgi:hypothetical protein